MDLGSFTEYHGRPAVRFEREFAHDIDRVWAAVSDPGELARWFPSTVEYAPHAGASITFSGDPNLDPSTGTVLAFDPPHRFAFTWGPDELHLELQPTDGGTRLVLINVLAERNTAARNASGWHVCLAELGKHLANVRSGGPHSENALSFQPLYDEYVAAGLPSGAWIPGAAT